MAEALIFFAIIAAMTLGMILGKRQERARADRAAKPMKMIHVFGCKCGRNTTCSVEQLAPGAVFECPDCLQQWAHITPKGRRTWIKYPVETPSSP